MKYVLAFMAMENLIAVYTSINANAWALTPNRTAGRNVRYGSKADLRLSDRHVR
jgi:hypothetical protein